MIASSGRPCGMTSTRVSSLSPKSRYASNVRWQPFTPPGARVARPPGRHPRAARLVVVAKVAIRIECQVRARRRADDRHRHDVARADALRAIVVVAVRRDRKSVVWGKRVDL